MTRLHHIGITVSDIGEAIDFYREITGGEVVGPLEKKGPAVEAATGYPGVVILIEIMRAFNLDEIECSEHDILYGSAIKAADLVDNASS